MFSEDNKMEFKVQEVYFGSNIARQSHLAVCCNIDNYILLSP